MLAFNSMEDLVLLMEDGHMLIIDIIHKKLKLDLAIDLS